MALKDTLDTIRLTARSTFRVALDDPRGTATRVAGKTLETTVVVARGVATQVAQEARSRLSRTAQNGSSASPPASIPSPPPAPAPGPSARAVTPKDVAAHVAPRRPTVEPVADAVSRPSPARRAAQAPGAKLPPRRTRTPE